MYLSIFKSLKKLKSFLVTIIFLPIFVLCILAVPSWSATGDYNGRYSGTFSGDDNGYWIAFVEDNAVKYYAWSTTNTYPDVDLDMSIDENGSFSGISDVNGSDISGTIEDGVVAGTYSNSDTGDSGTLEGGIESEPSAFAGNYIGTWSGSGYSGSWTMTIYDDGRVESIIDGERTAEGGVDSDGRMITFSEIGTGGFGNLSDDSDGIWVNTTNGDTGTSSGTLVDTEAGGGGGGGGCFVQIITQ